MLERDYPPRSRAVPLGHKVIAVIIAVAVGWGLRTWLNHHTTQSASTATLSFDPAVARHIDEGLMDGREPAAAFAQSILNDEVIAGLSKPAYLSSSAMSSRIGEFRSRLELTQPSATSLGVAFRDANPSQSAATANAVAKALVAWSPSATPSAAPAPAESTAPNPPPAAPPPVPVQKPAAAVHPAQPSHPISDSLGEIQAQLTAANRNLDRLGSSAGRSRSGYRPHTTGQSSYTQSKQQQLLKTEVKGAQKKLSDLRVHYANQYPNTGVRDRLAEIQQALVSVWPGTQPKHFGGSRGFNAAGTDASQLRRERTQLTHVIALVDKERQAIRRVETAQPVSESDLTPQTAAPSASASAAPAATPSASPSTSPATSPAASGSPQATPSQTTPPAPSATPAAEPSSQNPLRVVRLAGSAAPAPLWPPLAAGVVCGLLYLGLAAWRYRRLSYEDGYAEEATAPPQRLITPDEPVPTPPTPVSWIDPAPVDRTPRQRASFTYEPPPADSVSPQGETQTVQRSVTPEAPVAVEPPADTIDPPSAEPEPVPEPEPEPPHHQPLSQAAEPPSIDSAPPAETAPSRDDAESSAHGEEPHLIATREPAPVADNLVEMEDPWADEISKTLSETSIGKMFEARRDQEGTSQNGAGQQHSSQPNRRAG
jgi:hypothetical protein